MSVYVVISDTVTGDYESHGLHGVYATKDKAKKHAIASILGTAKSNYINISESDICIDDEYDDIELSYQHDNFEIYVSCIKQEVF